VTAWANIHRRGTGRYRQCGGKVRYRTLRQARWSAAERRRVSGEMTISAYRCAYGRIFISDILRALASHGGNATTGKDDNHGHH
jgi:hypothetical protein